MSNFKPIYLTPLALLVGIYLLIGYLEDQGVTKTKEIDWRKSFVRNDKIPYGTYVVYQEVAKTLFDDITPNQKPLKTALDDRERSASLVHIDEGFYLREEDISTLLKSVSRGNEAFIAAERFSGDLTKNLGFDTDFDYMYREDTSKVMANFVHKSLKRKGGYDFTHRDLSFYFNQYNDDMTTVLAKTQDDKPVFIRIDYGDGAFYLASTPFLWTNYFLLMEDKGYLDYISKAMSFLPKDKELIWDSPEHVSNDPYGHGFIGAILRTLSYMLTEKALNWAFWLIVATTLLYVAFEFKRTQRVIPVINPLPNTTLQFTETIGRLYYSRKNHRNIADKRAKAFLEHVRRRYYIRTHILDEAFVNKLALKSGVERAQVELLTRRILGFQQQQIMSEDALISLSADLDSFYTNSDT